MFFVVQILHLLVKIYQGLPSPDYINICQCLMFLNDPDAVATTMERLLRSTSKVAAPVPFFFSYSIYAEAVLNRII